MAWPPPLLAAPYSIGAGRPMLEPWHECRPRSGAPVIYLFYLCVCVCVCLWDKCLDAMRWCLRPLDMPLRCDNCGQISPAFQNVTAAKTIFCDRCMPTHRIIALFCALCPFPPDHRRPLHCSGRSDGYSTHRLHTRGASPSAGPPHKNRGAQGIAQDVRPRPRSRVSLAWGILFPGALAAHLPPPPVHVPPIRGCLRCTVCGKVNPNSTPNISWDKAVFCKSCVRTTQHEYVKRCVHAAPLPLRRRPPCYGA